MEEFLITCSLDDGQKPSRVDRSHLRGQIWTLSSLSSRAYPLAQSVDVYRNRLKRNGREAENGEIQNCRFKKQEREYPLRITVSVDVPPESDFQMVRALWFHSSLASPAHNNGRYGIV